MEICWEKPLEMSNGVTVGYWKMLEINVNVQTGLASVLCGGWISKSAKDDGKEMITDAKFQIDFTTFDPTGEITLGLVGLVSAAQTVL